jgi:hypothetical protein
VSRSCGCEPGCKPLGGSALLSPGIVWADVVREIEEDNPEEDQGDQFGR